MRFLFFVFRSCQRRAELVKRKDEIMNLTRCFGSHVFFRCDFRVYAMYEL